MNATESPIVSSETIKKGRLYHSRTTDEIRAANLICRERKKKPACLGWKQAGSIDQVIEERVGNGLLHLDYSG